MLKAPADMSGKGSSSRHCEFILIAPKLHFSPGNRDAQRRAGLRIGAGCGREPRETMTALALVPFGEIERDRAERGS